MKGFTLVELLIVIAILSILSTLGITNFQTAKIKARDLERKSDLQTIAKGLEAYANDHRGYPLSDLEGKIICQEGGVTCDWGDSFTDGTSVYSATLPAESNQSRKYVYVSSSGQDYQLYAYLENQNDPAVTTFTPAVSCGDENCNYQLKSSNTP